MTELRLQEFTGREIVNIYNGMRLGDTGDCDLLIDEETGRIEYLMIPNKKNQFVFLGEKCWIDVPWESIKRIGSELVIIEIEPHRGSLL